MDSEIIISGIAGRYPESDNLDEFWKNLIDGVDMISEDNRRWNIDAYDMSGRMGKIPSIDKFDAEYFGVHVKQVNAMDPKLRIALEVTHEALLDAGVNPVTLRATTTGVFTGVGADEANSIWHRSSENPSGYINLGSGACMMSNRVSFSFDFKGPSYSVDTACSSSFIALQNAFLFIRSGLCESAIVSGIQVIFDPHTTMGFHIMGMVSKEGKSRVFDANASGYVRAEAVVSIYVCKKGRAKRSYAKILGAKINTDGFKKEGVTFPSTIAQARLVRQVYEECGISPLAVKYVEAHGTGTQAGDPEELNALASVFCEGRVGPLLVGSVKSNMGHSEFTSGLCGLSKVLLAHRFGMLPANRNFETPNPNIPSLLDGRVKVVSENAPFNERYVAVNSFGYGGSNVHVLLELTPKIEGATNWNPALPVLLPVSGRNSEAVAYLLHNLSFHGSNQNVIALVHGIFKIDIPRYRCRGYAILGTDKPEIHVQEQPSQAMRPVWFVFTGLGCQWTGMTRDVMKFKAFQQSILKSDQVLKTNNYQLLEFLNNEDPEAVQDFKNSMVSITAIQVALADLLASVGVQPDGIVGHSTGEVASAYADGALSHEQAVLVSHGRARAFLESNLPPGTVAAVGLTWEEAKSRCPEGVFPAIHNSTNNVTIAGPPETILGFIEQLKGEGILAKEVQSAVCGFHSPYVYGSEKMMRELLGKIILEPKTRSSKWLSSSVPADKWDSELAKYSSVDYHVNNALSPVYFYETLQHVPEDAIVLEVGPHCFMQTILKQALPGTAAKIGLMSKHTDDNASYFLNALGKLYVQGGNMDVSKLYDTVEFPVGPETPMISPWIKWDHSQTWDVPDVRKEISKGGGTRYTIDLTKESDVFYEGHFIDGRIIYPATGYMHLVWKAFALQKGMPYHTFPIVFENLRIERGTVLNRELTTELVVTFFEDSGEFEVTESGVAVFRGRVRTAPINGTIDDEMFESFLQEETDPSKPVLTKEDCYKELKFRGYEYSGMFIGISSICMDGDHALLEWQDNWVPFLDIVLQASIACPHRGLYLPIRIEKITIDPLKFKQHLDKGGDLVPISVSKTLATSQCPGIEVRGIKVALAPRKINRDIPTITEHKFLPYVDEEIYSFEAALDFCIGIAIDNTPGKKFIFSEYFSQATSQSVSTFVSSQCAGRFEGPEYRLAHNEEAKTEPPIKIPALTNLMSTVELKSLDPCHLLYVDTETAVEELRDVISPKGFLLIKNNSSTPSPDIIGFRRIAVKNIENCKLTLYRSDSNLAPIAFSTAVETKDFSWVDTLKEQLATNSKDRIVLVSHSTTGINGLVKSLILESGGENIRAISIESGHLELKLNEEPITSQLQSDLVFNVYRNGVWGCYGNLVIPIEELQSPRIATAAYANVLTTGDLSSLSWIEGPLKVTGAENKLCDVSVAALNFKDVMLATGKLSRGALPGALVFDDCVLGVEYAGVYDSKRIMGICPSKCLATKLIPLHPFVWEIPPQWSFEEAATVPAVYGTAIYALIVRGNMKPGESVLIHAGSGGVGQAAITVALDMGCKVYTTVGTKEKREFLKARFPQLLDENISDSRSARVFEKHIKEQTQGRGVDIVLNSLAQDKLYASIRCLAKYGRFLEIGKFDLFDDKSIGLSVLLKSVRFEGVFMDELMDADSGDVARVVALCYEGLHSGMIQPLPFTSFSHDQLEDAFRYMAAGKHIGKVIVKLETGGIPSLPRTYFHPHKSYVLVGGLGGMGLEIANWMVERCCRKLILNSRSGVKNSYQQYRIKVFREKGVTVVVDQSDVASPEGATSVLKTAAKLGPIGGIFNMALVLEDSLFENQTPAHFEAALKVKILATSELDRASRTLAPELEHFVVFSSMSAARGNAGQTNYGFSNSFMERICEQRKRNGLPGLAIQWGLVDEVGVAFDNVRLVQDLQKVGVAPQKMTSWLATLDLFLRQDSRAVLGSFIHKNPLDSRTGTEKNTLANGVARILGIEDASKINPESTLFDLGMDSLMASEIKQLLSTKVGDTSTLASTPGQLTFAQIIAMDAGSLLPEPLQDRKQKLYPIPESTIRKLKSLEQGEDTIFMVHPMDGSLASIELLISHLDATVYGIEAIRGDPMVSLEALAKFYVQEMKKVQPAGPYKLAGFSFGGAVAFEMALQLEQEGSVVDSLLFLDSCPKWKQILRSSGYTEDLTSVLVHYVVSYLGLQFEEVEKDLLALSSWDKRVEHVAQLMKDVFTEFDLEEMKELAQAFTYRVGMAFLYEPTGKVKCRTMLIKCLKGFVDKTSLDDYGISESCLNPPVEVTAIEGTHYCFIHEPLELKIPDMINEMYKKVP